MLEIVLAILVIVPIFILIKNKNNPKVEIEVDNTFTVAYAKKITESLGQDVLIDRTKREIERLKSKIKYKSEQGYYRYSTTDYSNTYENKTILTNVVKYFRTQGFDARFKEYGFSYLEVTIEWD